MSNIRVKHLGTPAEPFAQPGMFGVIEPINPSDEKSRPHITPATRGIPAQAYVAWGEGNDTFHTWERLSTLQFLKKDKR